MPLEVSAYNLGPRDLSHFGTLRGAVDAFCKMLKTKAFIYEKSLDTPVFGLIRFRQKVLTESKPPLELFSLEKRLPCCRVAFSFCDFLCAITLASLNISARDD